MNSDALRRSAARFRRYNDRIPPSSTDSGEFLFAGKYRLTRRLAQGGSADVFLAQLASGATGFEKTVVLKRILPELAQDESQIRALLEEARTAATLHHPNVVDVYDVGEHQGEWFIAMEYVEGPTLRELQSRHSVTKSRPAFGFTLAVGAGIARGLHHAHSRVHGGAPSPVVHRDVKPHNVIVTKDGVVKVVDFGIAITRERAETTEQGVVKGTPGYLSPEQIRREKADARSDQFSLGIILWELLAGERLFHHDDMRETIAAILGAPIRPPSAFGAPPDLDEIVLRALSREPLDRYASCGDLADALEHASRQLTPDWTTASFRDAVENAPVAAAAPPAPATRRYFDSPPPLVPTVPSPKAEPSARLENSGFTQRWTPRAMATTAVAVLVTGVLLSVAILLFWKHWWAPREAEQRIDAIASVSGPQAALAALDAEILREPSLAPALAARRKKLDIDAMVTTYFRHPNGAYIPVTSHYPHDGEALCMTARAYEPASRKANWVQSSSLEWYEMAYNAGAHECVDEHTRDLSVEILDDEMFSEVPSLMKIWNVFHRHFPAESDAWLEKQLDSGIGPGIFNAARIAPADPRATPLWIPALSKVYYDSKPEALIALMPLDAKSNARVVKTLDMLEAGHRSYNRHVIDDLRKRFPVLEGSPSPSTTDE